MNWEAIGAIAELGGAIGVIGSLVYLGFQIRQNSKHIESSIYQSTNDVFVEFFSNLASDSRLADIWYSEIVKDNVSRENLNQARALLVAYFLALENNYQHEQAGLTNRATLSHDVYASMFNVPFVQNWLSREGRGLLTSSFLARIEEIQNAK